MKMYLFKEKFNKLIIEVVAGMWKCIFKESGTKFDSVEIMKKNKKLPQNA